VEKIEPEAAAEVRSGLGSRLNTLFGGGEKPKQANALKM
jgi:hypothetical protein